ncbi:MAG TPA: hypothetical protein PK224_13830 [Nitrospira sp.]|nr:hypothetical protein [Nitrospira sp.]
MRSDKKSPLKSDKKVPPKVQKKGSIGFNKKSALLEDAITQMNAGKYGRASSALKDLLALDPLNAEARRLFATLHLRLGSLMSARTAFESLAREAMERQDYWLAESLLREYLTAGPRYVPFLEMLGRVYEEKGDVMAAVAEYGKAVEVLLEDPDTDHPNRASELFARIRSLAPGSPVAFRFAAMFDTVTGQVLQVTPQPPVVDSISETAHAPVLTETSQGTDSAVVMPWEQVETASSDVPRPQEIQVSAVESPEVIAFTTTPSRLEAVTEGLSQARPEEPLSVTLPVDSPQESEVQLQSESSVSAVTSAVEPVQVAGESDLPVLDVALVSTEPAELVPASVAEVSLPAIDASVKTGLDSIATPLAQPAPMPWDQVEEAAGIIPSQPEGPAASPAGIAPTHSGETAPTPSVAELAGPTIEVLTQSSAHPIATAPASPAPMPWDQIEEVAVVIASPPSSPEPVMVEPESLPPTQNEVSTLPLAGVAPFQPVEPEPPAAAALMPFEEMDLQAPVSEPIAPTIEVLTQASSQPIAQAPTSPASMPWDQIEEATDAVDPRTETLVEPGTDEVEKAIESPAPNHAVEVSQAAESVPSSRPSELTSSGLSWEEILAAVAAMQTSPAPAQTLSDGEQKPAVDAAVQEQTAGALTAPPASPEEESPLFEATVPDIPADQAGTATTLSAPMPWEQIEVDDVTIPRQEPEPEFGPAFAEGAVSVQDSTVALPAAPDVTEATVAREACLAETVADRPLEPIATVTAELRILSPDAPTEAPEDSIRIPVEPYKAVEVPTPDAVPEAEQPAESTIDRAVEPPLRLADSESAVATSSGEPPAASVEPVTEFAIAVSTDVTSMEPEQVTVEEPQVPVGEPVAELPLEPVLLVEQPAEILYAQEVIVELAPEAVAESRVPAATPFLADEKPVAGAEPVTPDAPLSSVVLEVTPQAEPEMALTDQEPSSPSAAEVREVDTVPISEFIVPPVEASLNQVAPPPEAVSLPRGPLPIVVAPEEPVLPPVEPTQAAVVSPSPELVETPAESVAPSEEQAPAPMAQVASPPDAGEGLRILWDDTSSKPTPSASTRNMLTRWLKKRAEPVPAEVAEATPPATVSDEAPAPVPALSVEHQEPAVVAVERPPDEQETVAPMPVDAPVARPKPSQPVGAGAWTRMGELVASLVGAGVSTTQSLVVMVLALVGLTLVLIGGAVGVVALTWLVLEEQPSAAYRTMTSVPQRTLEDSSRNGYVLLLGFGAAASQDPVQAGMDRRVEGADRAYAHTCLTGEGVFSGGDQGVSAESVGKWMKTADPAAQMRADAIGVKGWASRAEVSMGRYRQWLTKPFEDWGYGQSITPNCGLILYAHRLYIAEGFAQDVEAGVTRLESDLTAWRTVLGQAKTLPVKMLASAAMNDDIVVMSGLLLRPELDDRFVSRLAKLARPLEQAEQSVRWPMQSQFVLATKTLDEAVSEDRSDARPFYGPVAAALPLPKQRRFNAYAQYYEAAGKAAAEGRYTDLPKQSQFVHAPPYGLGDIVMNPIESLVGVDPLPTWETYAGRVLETDARLRLASLQGWLRRTPPEQDLLTRIAKAGQGVYDPFTGFPMLVNMKKGVLYSVGQDLKDNEAQDRFDLVAPIPSVAWAGGKRPADADKSK